MLQVSDEQVARYLGLTGLRVGAGRIAVAERIQPQVLAWWAVSVLPSFDRSFVVGAIHEELWSAGPNPDWVAAKGFLVDVEGAAVADLKADPALEAFGQLN